MKNITKEWITSIIGVALLLLGGAMLWFEKDTLQIVIAFAVGLGSLFAKDDLIKKLFGKM